MRIDQYQPGLEVALVEATGAARAKTGVTVSTVPYKRDDPKDSNYYCQVRIAGLVHPVEKPLSRLRIVQRQPAAQGRK